MLHIPLLRVAHISQKPTVMEAKLNFSSWLAGTNSACQHDTMTGSTGRL